MKKFPISTGEVSVEIPQLVQTISIAVSPQLVFATAEALMSMKSLLADDPRIAKSSKAIAVLEYLEALKRTMCLEPDVNEVKEEESVKTFPGPAPFVEKHCK